MLRFRLAEGLRSIQTWLRINLSQLLDCLAPAEGWTLLIRNVLPLPWMGRRCRNGLGVGLKYLSRAIFTPSLTHGVHTKERKGYKRSSQIGLGCKRILRPSVTSSDPQTWRRLLTLDGKAVIWVCETHSHAVEAYQMTTSSLSPVHATGKAMRSC